MGPARARRFATEENETGALAGAGVRGHPESQLGGGARARRPGTDPGAFSPLNRKPRATGRGGPAPRSQTPFRLVTARTSTGGRAGIARSRRPAPASEA